VHDDVGGLSGIDRDIVWVAELARRPQIKSGVLLKLLGPTISVIVRWAMRPAGEFCVRLEGSRRGPRSRPAALDGRARRRRRDEAAPRNASIQRAGRDRPKPHRAGKRRERPERIAHIETGKRPLRAAARPSVVTASGPSASIVTMRALHQRSPCPPTAKRVRAAPDVRRGASKRDGRPARKPSWAGPIEREGEVLVQLGGEARGCST